MGRRRSRRARRSLVLLAVALLALLAAYAYASRESAPAGPPAAVRAEGVLRVHYLDVGQGDGTVWDLPGGALVVFDCGPPAPSAEENPMVRYLRDTLGRAPGSRIAALVASHGHLDHIGGCEEVLAEYEVEHVYEAWYEGADAPASYRRFQDEVRAEGATLHTLAELRPGSTLAVPDVRATLLWPPGFAPGGWDAIAESGLVVRLEHGSTSFCFQGDIEERQEAQLDAACDVYLVGHHGSRHASSARWLARMGPEVAVVSYGENAYGHPHPEALCRVQQAGAEVYATARAGDIVVESDGASVRVARGQPETVDHCRSQTPHA